MRRMLVLLALVAIGAGLVAVIEAPPRRTGEQAMRGPRVLRVAAHAVQSVVVAEGDRTFSAERGGRGWRLDGMQATPAAASALDDLVTTLAKLRAVDAFTPGEPSDWGLDPPRATITVETGKRRRRLDLGAMTSSGGAVYARRQGDRRLFTVGVGMLSAVDRVFYQRDHMSGAAPAGAGPGARGPGQPPEIG
ncbi:MAG: DUF4340 domain-containing protein [bacterium]|nr:DUF4340 domain-containing protein [bacterium]